MQNNEQREKERADIRTLLDAWAEEPDELERVAEDVESDRRGALWDAVAFCTVSAVVVLGLAAWAVFG